MVSLLRPRLRRILLRFYQHSDKLYPVLCSSDVANIVVLPRVKKRKEREREKKKTLRSTDCCEPRRRKKGTEKEEASSVETPRPRNGWKKRVAQHVAPLSAVCPAEFSFFNKHPPSDRFILHSHRDRWQSGRECLLASGETILVQGETQPERKTCRKCVVMKFISGGTCNTA